MTHVLCRYACSVVFYIKHEEIEFLHAFFAKAPPGCGLGLFLSNLSCAGILHTAETSETFHKVGRRESRRVKLTLQQMDAICAA